MKEIKVLALAARDETVYKVGKWKKKQWREWWLAISKHTQTDNLTLTNKTKTVTVQIILQNTASETNKTNHS